MSQKANPGSGHVLMAEMLCTLLPETQAQIFRELLDDHEYEKACEVYNLAHIAGVLDAQEIFRFGDEDDPNDLCCAARDCGFERPASSS